MKPPIGSIDLPFSKESELRDHLAQHPKILADALKDRIRIVGTEVKTDDEYRCDIVAESESRFYPIELKIGQATHQVVSQSAKYAFYFYRKLRYNFFREIQSVVVTNGSDAWAINELRREGVWLFHVRVNEDHSIRLERQL